MTTVTDSNVHNIALDGTFDDGQAIVKTLFADADFRANVQLGAVNSINWARILAQASPSWERVHQYAPPPPPRACGQ